jgi:hypothetical protein
MQSVAYSARVRIAHQLYGSTTSIVYGKRLWYAVLAVVLAQTDETVHGHFFGRDFSNSLFQTFLFEKRKKIVVCRRAAHNNDNRQTSNHTSTVISNDFKSFRITTMVCCDL